jgi:hypothetical protein
MNFPIEIIQLILFSIRDTETYKNARLVCRKWYEQLNIVKRFHMGKLKEYIIFDKKSVITYYSNHTVKNEFLMKRNYSIVFREFNERSQLVNTVQYYPPYKIKQSKVIMNKMIVKEYDTRKDNIEKSAIPLVNMHPHCSLL